MSRPSARAFRLEGLRNLGPKSAEMLAGVGITTRDGLAKVGAMGACRQLRAAGHPVSRNMAYAIEGALMDCDWRALPLDFQKQIAVHFAAMKRELKNASPEKAEIAPARLR